MTNPISIALSTSSTIINWSAQEPHLPPAKFPVITVNNLNIQPARLPAAPTGVQLVVFDTTQAIPAPSSILVNECLVVFRFHRIATRGPLPSIIYTRRWSTACSALAGLRISSFFWPASVWISTWLPATRRTRCCSATAPASNCRHGKTPPVEAEVRLATPRAGLAFPLTIYLSDSVLADTEPGRKSSSVRPKGTPCSPA